MFVVLCLPLGLRNTTLKTEAKPHDLFICLYSSPSLCNNSGENIKVILIITESQKRAYIHTVVGLFNTIAFFAWGNMYSM